MKKLDWNYEWQRFSLILVLLYLSLPILGTLLATQFKVTRIYDGTTVKAEKEAREAKMGMWSQGDKYISPKEWRRMQRGK